MPDPSSSWLTIIGIGEDGMAGLGERARTALARADIVFGGPRHLALAEAGARGRAWPVPFSIEPVLAERGRRAVVLASGDPFWFGAGAGLASRLAPEEWLAIPGVSSFSLAAARLGWPLEEVACLGLHARALSTLARHLHGGSRLLVLMRDGAAPEALATFLSARGFGASQMTVMERLGGPRERIRIATAQNFALSDIQSPVLVAIVVAGAAGLPLTPGLPDDAFAHDGQITRQAVRAVTLAKLAPRASETLWDIGAGSGSVSVEWCLAGGAKAIAIEPRADRIANIRANAAAFGLDGALSIVEGRAPEALAGLSRPQAVFVGGGATEALLHLLIADLAAGTRIVVNAVTLETEALLAASAARWGGSLLRMEFSAAEPLGRMQGWRPSRPVVQWSVTR